MMKPAQRTFVKVPLDFNARTRGGLVRAHYDWASRIAVGDTVLAIDEEDGVICMADVVEVDWTARLLFVDVDFASIARIDEVVATPEILWASPNVELSGADILGGPGRERGSRTAFARLKGDERVRVS